MTIGAPSLTPSRANADKSMITVVGDRATRRVRGFVQAAERVGYAVRVVSYCDALHDRCPPPNNGIVRLDSPAECDATYRELLQAGGEPLRAAGGEPLDDRAIQRLALTRGAILYPRQWYYGFRRALEQLSARWNAPELRWVSTPAAVITAFDKLACLQRWSDLPTPVRYPQIQSYDELRQLIPRRHARLMLKLRYGYSAMGALALEWREHLVRAITTVEVAEQGGKTLCYLSKRPQVLNSELAIARLVDQLAREELIVEDWLPKARWQGRPFDVRVVVIGGRAHHVVGRANNSPFTNLNLDATRVSSTQLSEHLDDCWQDLLQLCEVAADRIDGAGVLGMDIIVKPNRRAFALLEANAFGDYLPELTHQGLSTWEAQIKWLRRQSESAR